MSNIAVRVENLSKKYQLGTIGYGSLRHDLSARWAHARGKKDPNQRLREKSKLDLHEDFWALKDLSFEVKQGERLGIIGRNGAGKSTLLKILSQVTKPTQGTIRLNGRVASLLEVGTGFHGELTGRENVYLNGAIMGMKRKEIQSKFDEIVTFAGVEQFIDTPVKRYSSGMYVRLAFSVAAHLEPEILVVDEVLAVGDLDFQKKCIGKMESVSQEQGRTILFVSHNMNHIKRICNTGMLLRAGRGVAFGTPADVIQQYNYDALDILKNKDVAEVSYPLDERKRFQLLSFRMLNMRGALTRTFECDEEIRLEFGCLSRDSFTGLYGYLQIIDSNNIPIIVSDSTEVGVNPLGMLRVGEHQISITIPRRLLGAGKYFVYLNFTSGAETGNLDVDSPTEVCTFEVEDPATHRGNNRNAVLSTLLAWEKRD